MTFICIPGFPLKSLHQQRTAEPPTSPHALPGYHYTLSQHAIRFLGCFSNFIVIDISGLDDAMHPMEMEWMCKMIVWNVFFFFFSIYSPSPAIISCFPLWIEFSTMPYLSIQSTDDNFHFLFPVLKTSRPRLQHFQFVGSFILIASRSLLCLSTDECHFCIVLSEQWE